MVFTNFKSESFFSFILSGQSVEILKIYSCCSLLILLRKASLEYEACWHMGFPIINP